MQNFTKLNNITVISAPYPKQDEVLDNDFFLTVPFTRLSDLDIQKITSLCAIVLVCLLVTCMGIRTESFTVIPEHKTTRQKSKISYLKTNTEYRTKMSYCGLCG